MKKYCTNCGTELEDYRENTCPWCDNELIVVRDTPSEFYRQQKGQKKLPSSPPSYPKKSKHKKITKLSKVLAIALAFMLILFFLSIDISDIGKNFGLDIDDDGGQATGTINKSYYWMYDGSSYSLNIEIPKENLMKYEDESHYSYDYKSHPDVFQDWITKDDQTMILITQKLIFKAHQRNFTDLQTKEFMLNFVQETIEYKADQGDWKYPVETLVDSMGDCEDVAFLYGTITEIAGYDSILVNYEVDQRSGHLMPAIYSPSKNSGDTIEFNGREYHFAETTNDLYTIGMGPDPTKYDYESFLTVDI